MIKKIGISLISIIFLLFVITNINAVIIQSVITHPEEISPGETARISLIVKNNGEEDIEDFSAILDLTDVPIAPYDSGIDFSIDEIREGKIREVFFNIIALNSAKSGIYKVPIKMSYTEDEEKIERNSLISVMIFSLPEIEVSIEEGLFIKGQENEISLKIINKGLSDSKFLEIELESSSFYTILTPPNSYIGDVDSDDFQNVEYKILFKENIPSRINLPVIVKYKDVTNKEYTEINDLDLKIYSTKDAIKLGLIKTNNYSSIVIIIIVVIILIIIWRVISKRRKKKKKIEN
ncbi:hypothetical protein GOV12_01165 [Candidatus Pacearchaeota archaeon]|nr:hypothetical protein [Candidatus Pacearchaeota archaeon]